MSKQQRNLAMGAMFAAVAGYAVGLLTAPKAGKETRQQIQNATIKAKAEAERFLKTGYSDIVKLTEEVKQRTHNVTGIAKKDIEKAVSIADSAKQKAREMLSTLRDGSADDNDLQKAVDEVNQAITHLNKFLKKDAEEV